MTISATSQETDPRVAQREAWVTYSESLRDLAGKDYEDAEHTSWERLQRALQDIDAANATVQTTPGALD
ncbi:MAG: hypothetical protein QOJ82_2765 [Solirubrobacteraceae bacterium]|jgi:hypothetical protein|nr:hypothetical protein [Solirubrobacteraceae bacterium]